MVFDISYYRTWQIISLNISVKPSRHAKQKKSVSAKSAYANTSKTTKRNSPPKKPNSKPHKTNPISPNHKGKEQRKLQKKTITP